MLKEGQLLCRMDYEKEREMLAAISPTPTESGIRKIHSPTHTFLVIKTVPFAAVLLFVLYSEKRG